LLKIGVKNILAAELFASSLVADLHLIPAFIFLQVANNETMAISLAIGAIVANLFSLALVLIEAMKTREEF
jgi:stage V sporulation protein SpoVS